MTQPDDDLQQILFGEAIIVIEYKKDQKGTGTYCN
jgi:hypothetical protein